MSETVKDMTDEELLAQINCHDPYDVEFTKRFQSLTKERDALQARVAELEESAERWDALMASQRIRHFGSANFNWSMDHDEVTAPKDPENWLHLGIELWDRHSAPHPCEEFPQDRCRNFLLAYVDHIRQALKENQDG